MIVTVHAKQVAKRLTKEEDEGIAGRYQIRVDDDVKLGHVAGVALDVFHTHVAVAMLDDFDFSVRHGRKVLVEDDDYESYSGEHKGELLWSCSDGLDIPQNV